MRKVKLWLKTKGIYLYFATIADMIWLSIFGKDRVMAIGMANYQVRKIKFAEQMKYKK
jgi:hypothetical protein